MKSRCASFFKLCLFISIFLQTASFAKSENIVFFLGVSTYSHRVPIWPVAEELAAKGHNITFVSPFPAKNPNPKIRDYVPQTLVDWMKEFEGKINFFELRKVKSVVGWAFLPMLGRTMCEELYKDDGFVNWVKTTKVDLVFLDALVNDCAYGMIHHWGAKTILYHSSNPLSWFTSFGLPDETSWIPTFELSYSPEMTFSQRLSNALVPVVWHYFRKWIFYPKLEEINRDKLGIPDLPSFEEIARNTSLIFINSHYSEEFARSLPPNIIAIGGMTYTDKRKELPKGLDEFVNKGDGFVYLSFGSQANFLDMDESMQQAFIGAMKSLPKLQFVWKVDNLSLVHEFPNKNVYIQKWMPQNDILAHPKIKAFITHAGLLGIHEAVYNSVPLISFPIFAEQDYNAERVHRREYGIRLEITTVTQSEIVDAINQVLSDPKYRNNMKKVSTLFKERPQKPFETAMWWTEFVLRHSQEDLTALRPFSVSQAWWQRRQLDVWATIFLSTFIILIFLTYISYKILRWACCTSKKVNKNDVRKKVQ